MARNLATVQTIVNLEPIPNADNIIKCSVLGWQCIVAKKDNLSVGDKVIFVEVDSLMPAKPEYEFLKERKYRIRTIKLRGTVSQGLVLPLSYLPKGNYGVGDDVSDKLGVRKYDPQADLEAKMLQERTDRQKNKVSKFLMRYGWFRRFFSFGNRATFPSFIRKTDELRIQLFPDICEEKRGMVFDVTEKLDGQSATYFLVKSKGWFGKVKYSFGVCSRNLLLPNPNKSSYWTVAKNLNIEAVLRDLIEKDDFVVLQGEILGWGIQGNKYHIDGCDFRAFNLIVPLGRFEYKEMSVLLSNRGVKCVPYLGTWVLPDTIQECVNYAEGGSTVYAMPREGVVIRNGDFSVKIINPTFLLKYEE